jgi:hypothetical protein
MDPFIAIPITPWIYIDGITLLAVKYTIAIISLLQTLPKPL